jgi:hypothetical protein
VKSVLKKFIKNTPIYRIVKSIIRKKNIMEWTMRGKPLPPPHSVKQQTIMEFAERYHLKILVETGTYFGNMVEAMKPYFRKIYSIELSNDLYNKAKQRFSGDEKVTIVQGDSGTELGNLIRILDGPALFWLDAHYSSGITVRGEKDTPIYEELDQILSTSERRNVVIIDDARCFGSDPAYPSIDELNNYIRSKRPNVCIEIVNDSIRIIPDN